MKFFLILLATVTMCRCLPLQSGVVPNTAEKAAKLASGNYKQEAWEISGQFEGDMVLTPEQREALLGLTKNAVIVESFKWPKKVVPYTIDKSDFTQEQIDFIDLHVKKFAEVSCVTVRRKVATDWDYVKITGKKGGCFAWLGHLGGKQRLNLEPSALNEGCLRSAVIQHEFLHALGFVHQQSATDRDDYITIVWENIVKGMEHNFEKYNADVVSSFGVPYDYGSVMHYAEYDYSKNGERTIIPKDETAVIGQREEMSEKDIEKLNLMYCSK